MAKRLSGREQVRSWRRRKKLDLPAAGRVVGDRNGWQIAKYEVRGGRDLPIDLASKLSVAAGIRLRDLLTRSQLATARRLVTALARDAAA